MSYERERRGITNFIKNQNDFGLVNFGLDGDVRKEGHLNGFMTIIPGEARIGSIQGPDLLVRITSVLMISFWTDGGKGSGVARTKAQEIIDLFFERRIDENGAIPNYSMSDIVMDFSDNGFVPYISGVRSIAPWFYTTINAPFVRSEKKSRVRI